MQYIGEIAALFASFCVSLSATGFTMAGRNYDSTTINRIRVVLAYIVLLVLNFALYGQAIPFSAEPGRWAWLTVSGIVGLAIGDYFLYSSYQLVGPRIGLLLLSLAPVYSIIIAWIFFHEALSPQALIGIAITLAGIIWVVLTRQTVGSAAISKHLSNKGLIFGLIAGISQATGLVLSKQGMAGNFPPFAGTLIRMNAALFTLWIPALYQKNAAETLQKIKLHPATFGWVAFGSLFGPVLAVSATMLSLQSTDIGIASTLMALPPVFMLPISYFFFKERFGWSTVAGTALAILGVGLLLAK